MTNTARKSQQAARRHLLNVSSAEVEAMHALDGDVLAALVSGIYTLTTNDDVREHAAIIVASLMPGAASIEHAARAAVGIAKRHVAMSGALAAEDLYGDMTEEVATRAEDYGVTTTMARYAPDPATAYAPTFLDLLGTAVRATGDDGLKSACVAYLAHARDCQDCSASDSHRVTLAGVRAHMEGRGAADASYHSERRAVLRALARVGTFSDLAERIGDPAPLATPHPSHGSVSHGDTRPTSTRDQVAPVRTVTHNGTPRAMHAAEVEALRITTERAARYDGEEYRGGTHGAMSAQADAFTHAPHAAANTGEATTPGQALPSGAVPVSPRKRARTGSTGPTVPIW